MSNGSNEVRQFTHSDAYKIIERLYNYSRIEISSLKLSPPVAFDGITINPGILFEAYDGRSYFISCNSKSCLGRTLLNPPVREEPPLWASILFFPFLLSGCGGGRTMREDVREISLKDVFPEFDASEKGIEILYDTQDGWEEDVKVLDKPEDKIQEKTESEEISPYDTSDIHEVYDTVEADEGVCEEVTSQDTKIDEGGDSFEIDIAKDSYGDGVIDEGVCEDLTSQDTKTDEVDDSFEIDLTNDSDGDGLIDAEEEIYGTNKFIPDTDGDGLKDGEEVLVLKTNPLLKDTDGDNLTDGDEVLVHGTDPKLKDTDAGGLDDYFEVLRGTDAAADKTDDFTLGINLYFSTAQATCPAPPDPLKSRLIILAAKASTGDWNAVTDPDNNLLTTTKYNPIDPVKLSLLAVTGTIEADSTFTTGLPYNGVTIIEGAELVYPNEWTALDPYGSIFQLFFESLTPFEGPYDFMGFVKGVCTYAYQN